MAHELEMLADGTASMAYRQNGGLPWHGLGTPVSDDMSAHAMMEAAGLDWTVSLQDSFYQFNGEMLPTGQRSLVRDSDGKLLSNVGMNWKPVQNETAFEFFKEYVDAGEMMMETAGSLHDGKLVWALANINDGFTLANGDEVKGHMLLVSPHQYGRSVFVRTVMTRVVCQNTLTMALREKGDLELKLNHSREFVVEDVKEALGMSRSRLEEYAAQADHLRKKSYKKGELQEYFVGLFGKSKKDELTRTGEQVMGLVENSPGCELAPGSWWNAFNAVTYHTTHEMGRTVESRADSAAFGAGARLNAKAMELALEMAD